MAVIVAVRGEVQVAPSEGEGFAARPELQLLRDDRLTVEPGSFVVVALHNGYLVRLNEGTGLRVDGLASFDDAPTGADLEQRFSALLSPSEREDEALRRSISRVAGWNTRMTAADTIPTQPAQARAAAPASASAKDDEAPTVEVASLPDTAPSGGVAAGPPVAAPPAEAKDDAPRRGADKVEPPKKIGSGPKTRDRSDSDEMGGDVKTSASSDLPAEVTHHSALTGERKTVSLPAPLKQLRQVLARCAGAGAVVRVEIKAGRFVALKINGVASQCTPALIGEAVALTDGWIEMTVTP